jgi:predicted DNA-binding ribbon-helix-helix protein
MTWSELISAIDSERQQDNLSSAIRLFVLDLYRHQISSSKQRPEGVGEERRPFDVDDRIGEYQRL